MKKRPSAIIFFLLFLITAPSFAQRVTFKPLAGYYLPKLEAVNDDIAFEIPFWRDFLEADLPNPGKIREAGIYGGQVQIHLRENYFASLHVSFYRDAAKTQFVDASRAPAAEFSYSREVEFYDVLLTMQYYFDYDADNAFNTYLRIGAGVLSANANTETKSTFTTSTTSGTFLQLVDTQGDFSGSTLTASLSAGAELHLTSFLSIWGEAGMQIANIGQMDGTLKRINNSALPEFTTDTTFDLSGLFVRVGGGFGLPF